MRDQPDDSIRKLEGQRDLLTAESSALDTSLGYLKALGSGEAPATPAAGIRQPPLAG